MDARASRLQFYLIALPGPLEQSGQLPVQPFKSEGDNDNTGTTLLPMTWFAKLEFPTELEE